MKLSVRSLVLIGLLGGLGGAINAWLCYARIPVSASEFSWPIIPAGMVHGATLAVVALGLASRFAGSRTFARWVGVPVTGWLSGWLACIPINLYMERVDPGPLWESRPPLLEDLFEAATWPFRWELEALWTPYAWFGLVGASSYVAFVFLPRRLTSGVLSCLLLLSLSGSLGSLWWWIAFKHWYLSLIHGTIWGSLVGFGVWKSQQWPVGPVERVHHL